MKKRSDVLEMVVEDVEIGAREGEYHPVQMRTNRGIIEMRYYPAETTTRGAIWVGGAGGGWDSPARDLYVRLALQLQGEGIASLRVRYRHANDLPECTLDVLAGMTFLEGQGIDKMSLAGHSFGGAVVVQAGAHHPKTRTVITLSTQSYGIHPVSQLPADCSILVIHGQNDEVLPTQCSLYTYELAHEPKRIELFEHANHGLDQVSEQLQRTVRDWVMAELSR